MIQRRLRVVQWLSTTPARGVCILCSQEFGVPISALRRTSDAQASLQEQFDRHKCAPNSSEAGPGTFLRQEPDDDEDEEEDDRKKEDDEDEDENEGDGYSE